MNSKKTSYKTTIFLSLVYIVISAPLNCYAENHAIAVVLSQKIKPYMQVLKGVQQNLDNKPSFPMDIFSISDTNRDIANIKKELLKKKYTLFLAIGPEAAQLIWSMESLRHQPKLFSAILNPLKIDHLKFSHCGVSLQIPASIQLAEISASLPDIKKVGIIFDPKQNQTFFKAALESEPSYKIKVIPLRVNSKTEISKVLRNNLNSIDCVWMIPDSTVISEKIVQYVIKQALYKKKGVIGYNPYFIKSGAVFAFEFDYYQIGIQTAEKIRAYSNDKACNITIPFFNKTSNLKMARHLGITIKEHPE